MTSLSACMIVKNESEMLKLTLPVISNVVDELIVVDTGSSDDTISIAGSFGAIVKEFAWINDFAAARNESIMDASSEWILWIDADEYIKEEDLFALKKHLDSIPEEESGLMIPIYQCKKGELDEQGDHYSRVKLFRNNRGLRFDRPINEQVITPDGIFLQGSCWVGARIYHWGDVGITEERFAAKRQRNISMLEEVKKNNPDDFQYMFLLARNYYLAKDYSKVLGYLDEIQNKLTLPEYLYCEFYQLKLNCIKEINGEEAFFNSLVEMATKDPSFAWVIWTLAHELLKRGRIDEAEQYANSILELQVPAAAAGVDVDLESYLYKPYYILGVIYDCRQNSSQAMYYYKKALEFQYEALLANRVAELTSKEAKL